MKKKSLFAIFLAIVMLLSLVGCSSAETGSAAESKEETYSVYAVAPESGASWTRFKQGLDKACAELGWESTLVAPQKPYDAVEMAELCDTAVNAGADVIMIFTADTEFFKDTIEAAKEKGVLMISIAKPNPYCDLRVGTDDTNVGENIAQTLVDVMGDKPIKVIEMMSDVTSEGQMHQIEPFEAKLKELAPDAEIVDRIDCSYNAVDGADNLAASYNAHPEANCVISIDGGGSVGCSSFVSDYGIAGEFVVISVEDTAEVLQCLLDGSIQATVANQWDSFAYQAVYFAQDILVNGAELEFNQGVESVVIYPDEVEEYAAAHNISLE